MDRRAVPLPATAERSSCRRRRCFRLAIGGSGLNARLADGVGCVASKDMAAGGGGEKKTKWVRECGTLGGDLSEIQGLGVGYFRSC